MPAWRPMLAPTTKGRHPLVPRSRSLSRKIKFCLNASSFSPCSFLPPILSSPRPGVAGIPVGWCGARGEVIESLLRILNCLAMSAERERERKEGTVSRCILLILRLLLLFGLNVRKGRRTSSSAEPTTDCVTHNKRRANAVLHSLWTIVSSIGWNRELPAVCVKERHEKRAVFPSHPRDSSTDSSHRLVVRATHVLLIRPSILLITTAAPPAAPSKSVISPVSLSRPFRLRDEDGGEEQEVPVVAPIVKDNKHDD